MRSDPNNNAAFVAEAGLPEPRRFRITHTGIERSSSGAADWLGWEFVVNRLDPSGGELPLFDTWETTFLEVLGYLSDYSERPLEWRRTGGGDIVDLRDLQPEFDASRYGEHALKTLSSPDLSERLCFNLYSDGYYRFIRERLIHDDGLSAWIPEEWSREQHVDLASAEREARKKFAWAG